MIEPGTEVAFDPLGVQTALFMAIQAYEKTIIRDADYLKEAAKLARNEEGPKLRPATIDGIVDAAEKFDHFIAGAGVSPQSGDTP